MSYLIIRQYARALYHSIHFTFYAFPDRTLRENPKILGFNRNIEELIFISFCFKSHLEVPNGQILGDIDL